MKPISCFISVEAGHILSPNSDHHEISPHHIDALQHIQVMRIKQMIPKDELCSCLDQFSGLVLSEIYADQ